MSNEPGGPAGGPLVRIDPESSLPPYDQVRTQLAGQINDRTLAVGLRLPTVRALAAELGIAVNTVARAYRELEEAGLVRTQGRAGTFVSPAGEHTRARAETAAAGYAELTASLGLDPDEALRIVRAALRR